MIPCIPKKRDYCPTCGAQILNTESVFCLQCGSLLSANGSKGTTGSPGTGGKPFAREARPSQSPKPLKRKSVVGAAILFFIAVVLILLVLSQSGILDPLSSPGSTTAHQESVLNPASETPTQTPAQIPFSTRNRTLFVSTIAPTEQVEMMTPSLSSTTTTTETALAPTTESTLKNIIETAEADGRFTTFIAAVKAAGLDDTLSSDTFSGSERFTVFAPTDDAYKKLSPGSMDILLRNPQGNLLQILLYHVVSGKVTVADLKKLTTVDTLQGESLSISVSDGLITIDGAKVIVTDIECTNGVIHGVDTVMLPPA